MFEMQNLYYFSKEQMQQKITLIMCLLIEIVMLAYYANLKIPNPSNLPIGDKQKEYNSVADLQLAGSVMMMVGFIVIIVLHFLKLQHDYIKWVLIGNQALLGLGVFLILIGMAVMSQTIYLKGVQYNVPVGLWFIQLFIFVLGTLGQYILYYELEQRKKVIPINQGEQKTEPQNNQYNPNGNNTTNQRLQVLQMPQ